MPKEKDTLIVFDVNLRQGFFTKEILDQSMKKCNVLKINDEDTVGAGDSFTAAFVASIIRGMSVSEAHRRAVEVSAYVCTQAGAMPTLPAKFTT